MTLYITIRNVSPVYVNVKPGGGPIVLTSDTSKVRTMARKWNIKITQISCNAPERGKCLLMQYILHHCDLHFKEVWIVLY